MPPRPVLYLEAPDLSRAAGATQYVKDECVAVDFAHMAGELLSLEGPNRYRAGDALLTAAGGERWVVERARFDAAYRPDEPSNPSLRHGDAGIYRNRPVAVMARRIDQAFSVARRPGGDMLQGEPGDWLLQYASGDYGVVRQARFARVYRPLSEAAPCEGS